MSKACWEHGPLALLTVDVRFCRCTLTWSAYPRFKPLAVTVAVTCSTNEAAAKILSWHRMAIMGLDMQLTSMQRTI